MKIILPNGDERKYNDAHFASWGSEVTALYTKKDGDWLATITHQGTVIEAVPPCSVFRPGLDFQTAIRTIRDNMHRVTHWLDLEALAILKTDLAKFNRHTRRWRK